MQKYYDTRRSTMDLAKLLDGYDGTVPDKAPPIGPNPYAQSPRPYAPHQDPNSVAGMGTYGRLEDLQASGFNTQSPFADIEKAWHAGGVDSVKISAGESGTIAGIPIPAQAFDWSPIVVNAQTWLPGDPPPLHTKDD
jgi:hypothetical protein